MGGIRFEDGEPCPCCGRPLNLKQQDTAQAVYRLARVIAAEGRENRLDLTMLAIDSLFIAAHVAGSPGKAYIEAFIDTYCDLVALLDRSGSHEIVGMVVDDKLRVSGQRTVPYEKRRDLLADALSR